MGYGVGMDPSPVHADDDDAFCVGDDLVDWSRVEELPERISQVGEDKGAAVAFYDELAGH